MPCLGRPFKLGMLYDCRNDQIIPGVKLWGDNLLSDEQYLNIRPHISSSYDVIAEDSISDKAFHLGIEAGIEVSFLGGLIEVSGSAKFMQDKKSSMHQSRVSLQYKYTDRFEELTMEQMKGFEFSQPIDNNIATHVVTAVVYGADAFLVFDSMVSQSDDHTEVHGSMKASIEKLSAIADIKGHAEIDLDDSERENVSKFHCKFHGDVQLQQNPSNFEEAVQAYKDLPRLVKEKDEKGYPVTVAKKVWLYPLSLLDSKAARLVRKVGDTLITRAEDLMQNLDELAMRKNDLEASEVGKIFPGIHKQLSTFSGVLAKYTDDCKRNLRTLVPQIRSGEQEKEKELDKTFSAASQHLEHLSSWLAQKEEEVKILTTYLDSMKGIRRAYSPSDVYAAINNVTYKHVLCITMKASEKDDRKFSIDVNPEDTAVPWYKSPNLISDMRQKVKQFKDFANANKENKDLLCLVADGSATISDGNCAAITLYEEGKPIEFELPSQPGKPKATIITQDSIQLAWAKPQYGAQNVTSYIISYCPHNDSDKPGCDSDKPDHDSDKPGHASDKPWKTQKTEGVQEAATVTGLAHETAYDFKINAVCDLGISADSEISDTANTKGPIQIVPLKEAKGTDFYGGSSYQYIVRSDLGFYMRTYHVHDDDYVNIYPLDPSCSGGDHYIATSDYCYIIKGDSFRHVTDIYVSTDTDATTFTLHKKCRGGRFYMATNSENFYIIFDGYLKHVVDLEKDPGDEKQSLHPNCRGGLYYWATGGFFYFIKPVDKWGVEYHRTRDLTDDREGVDFHVHPTVTKFLPSGLGIIMGRTFGDWQLIKSIDNKDSAVDMEVSLAFTKKVGYNKDALRLVQQNSSVYSEGADMVMALFKKQFSLPPAYGGQVIDAAKEDWSEEHEVHEHIDMTVPSGKSTYIWQYVVGMKEEEEAATDVLYTQHLKLTDTPNKPTDVPFSMMAA